MKSQGERGVQNNKRRTVHVSCGIARIDDGDDNDDG